MKLKLRSLMKDVAKSVSVNKKEDFLKLEKMHKDYVSGKIKKDELMQHLHFEKPEQADSLLQAMSRVQTLERVRDSLEDSKARDRFDKQMEGLLGKNYTVGSTSDIRVVDASILTEDAWEFNTPFKNSIADQRVESTDGIRISYPKYDSDATTNPENYLINPNKGPDVQGIDRTLIYNTVSFFGSGAMEGRIAADITQNLGYENYLEINMRQKIDVLNKVESRLLLNGTENSSGPVFQNNGVLNLVTTNTDALGGDFTDSYIDTTLIKNTYAKYNTLDYILGVGSHRQLSILDTIRKTRTGIRSISDLTFGDLIPGKDNKTRVPVSTEYISLFGITIPVIYLPELPSGSALLYPRNSVIPVSMYLPSFGDSVGPFILISMTDNGWAKIMQMFKTTSVKVINENKFFKVTTVTGD
jgi:hypothetical protein